MQRRRLSALHPSRAAEAPRELTRFGVHRYSHQNNEAQTARSSRRSASRRRIALWFSAVTTAAAGGKDSDLHGQCRGVIDNGLSPGNKDLGNSTSQVVGALHSERSAAKRANSRGIDSGGGDGGLCGSMPITIMSGPFASVEPDPGASVGPHASL